MENNAARYKVEETETDNGEGEQLIDDIFLREWTETVDLKEVLDSKSEVKYIDAGLKDCNTGTANHVIEKQLDQNVEKGTEEPKRSCNAKIASDIDQLIEGLFKNAPISEKATSLCRFKCPKCGEESPSWKQIDRHIKAKSNCSRRIRFLDVGDIISKTVCHICKICKSRMLCDGLFMKRHMVMKHQISFSQYIKKFGLDCSKTTRKGDAYSDKIIGNLCVYTCEDCPEEFSSWKQLCKHQKVKGHSRTSLKDKFKVMKSTYHNCKLCHRIVLCEKRYLAKHIKQCHKLSIDEYCTKTGCEMQEDTDYYKLKSLETSEKIENLCIFTCCECNKKFHCLGAFYAHRQRENHQSQRLSVINNLVHGFSYKCKLCSSLMLCDRIIIQRHMTTIHQVTLCMKNLTEKQVQYQHLCAEFMKDLPVSAKVQDKATVQIDLIPVQEITSTIGNLCRFSCPHCDTQKLFHWGILKNHFKSRHSKKELIYSPSIVVTARYHSCLMCPKAILNDRRILSTHLNRHHKMRLAKYEKIYSKHGGKVLPTYRDWVGKVALN